MKKQVIRLTESDLKNIIAASVKQIIKEHKRQRMLKEDVSTSSYYTNIDILDVFENQMLEEWIQNNGLPIEEVPVIINYSYEGADGGDYWIAPIAAEYSYEGCVVDPKKTFAQYIPKDLYGYFIQEMTNFVDEHSDWYLQDIREENDNDDEPKLY